MYWHLFVICVLLKLRLYIQKSSIWWAITGMEFLDGKPSSSSRKWNKKLFNWSKWTQLISHLISWSFQVHICGLIWFKICKNDQKWPKNTIFTALSAIMEFFWKFKISVFPIFFNLHIYFIIYNLRNKKILISD